MPGQKINFYRQRLDALRTKRATFESQWEEAAERLVPAHKNSFRSRGLSNAMTPGRKNQEKMFDATAALALHRFASVIESLTTPQGQQWHRLVPSDTALRNHRPTRIYLDDLTSLLFRHRYRPAANFVGQSQKTYNGYGAYGNGLLFIDANEKQPGLRYKNFHLGETYIVENHQGIVDTFYRVFYLTPRQIVSMYGDGAPEQVKKKLKNPSESETEEEILHVVQPRGDMDPTRMDSRGMPFESVHIYLTDEHVMRESGYNTFPLAVARYMQFTNETYGRGPAQIVLPSIKVLNEEKRVFIKQGHRIADPVLLTHDDGVLGTWNLRPGAVNPGGVNAQGKPLVSILPEGNISVNEKMMEMERAVINDAFLITLFQILVDTPQMTATEVLERAREKGMLIAPTAGALQAGYLGPMIERELDVLHQQGLLPPPPAKLLDAGGDFQVEYDNPMSRMSRAENASGFMRALDQALAIVNVTQDPSPLDFFNFDVAMPAIQDIAGAPTAWTNTAEKVAEIRARRQQEVQDRKMIEAGPSLAAIEKTRLEASKQG